jgi:glycine/D-amino acid oxidase-like deaminating enzyme
MTSSWSGSAGWAARPPITSPRAAYGCSAWRSSAPHTTAAPATAARASSVSPTSRARTTCRRAGADLHFDEPLASWSPARGGGVRVETGAGTYEAGQLVITPGPWAPQLLADLGVPFTIERQVQYWFQPAGGVGPFVPERHPVYIWEDESGSQISGHGFKFVPVVGEILADLATTGTTAHPIGLFDPRRVSGVTS